MAPVSGLELLPRLIESNTQAGRTPSLTKLYVFLYFNLIVNSLLLPILAGTFLISKRAKRHPMLVNLCITWIFGGEFSLILFYAGKHVGPEPAKSLCVAQTSLLYGITPMWSVAVFMLLYYVLLCVRGKHEELAFWKLVVMLAAPYIVQIAFSISALTLSMANPEKVSRSWRFFYCALENSSLAWAMSIFTQIICVGIVILEVHLAIIAYRSFMTLRKAGVGAGHEYQFIARVLMFGLYITFGVGANILSMVKPTSTIPELYAATAGTAILLIFGTQPDVMDVWFGWILNYLPRSFARRIGIQPQVSPSFAARLSHWRGGPPGMGGVGLLEKSGGSPKNFDSEKLLPPLPSEKAEVDLLEATPPENLAREYEKYGRPNVAGHRPKSFKFGAAARTGVVGKKSSGTVRFADVFKVGQGQGQAHGKSRSVEERTGQPDRLPGLPAFPRPQYVRGRSLSTGNRALDSLIAPRNHASKEVNISVGLWLDGYSISRAERIEKEMKERREREAKERKDLMRPPPLRLKD